MATESIAGTVNTPVAPLETRVTEPPRSEPIREIAQTEVTLSQRGPRSSQPANPRPERLSKPLIGQKYRGL